MKNKVTLFQNFLFFKKVQNREQHGVMTDICVERQVQIVSTM